MLETCLEEREGGGEKSQGKVSRKQTRQKGQEDEAEKTTEEIGKRNQMSALRFQTGG